MKIKDAIWLWGQDVMGHHRVGPKEENIWNLPGVNRMGPVEGAEFFGIGNICRVVMNGKPEPPFANEMEKLKNIPNVIWSILGDSGSDRQGSCADDLSGFLELAAKYPNLRGGVLDDFFRPANRAEDTDKLARLSLERLEEIRTQLHGLDSPQELWVVIYESFLDDNYAPYLAKCDAVTFWTWYGRENLPRLSDNLKRTFELSPRQKHLGGLYLYDYGNCTEISAELLKNQCDLYTDHLKSGKLQGVIICSNCIADIGLAAADYVRDWVREIGDEELG